RERHVAALSPDPHAVVMASARPRPAFVRKRRPASSPLAAATFGEGCGLCPCAVYALRPAAGGGGPEGKLRGRPPPPRLSRSGPWRRTGSESITGRARTRLREVLTNRALSNQLREKP